MTTNNPHTDFNLNHYARGGTLGRYTTVRIGRCYGQRTYYCVSEASALRVSRLLRHEVRETLTHMKPWHSGAYTFPTATLPESNTDIWTAEEILRREG